MAPIRDGQDVIGVMVLTEDVTEEDLAGTRLAESLRLRESVLEALGEAIVVFGRDGTLLQANPAALRCSTSTWRRPAPTPTGGAVTAGASPPTASRWSWIASP